MRKIDYFINGGYNTEVMNSIEKIAVYAQNCSVYAEKNSGYDEIIDNMLFAARIIRPVIEEIEKAKQDGCDGVLIPLRRKKEVESEIVNFFAPDQDEHSDLSTAISRVRFAEQALLKIRIHGMSGAQIDNCSLDSYLSDLRRYLKDIEKEIDALREDYVREIDVKFTTNKNEEGAAV